MRRELEKYEELKRASISAKPPSRTSGAVSGRSPRAALSLFPYRRRVHSSLCILNLIGLGLKGLFYCSAPLSLRSFLVEKILQLFSSDKLLRVLVAIS